MLFGNNEPHASVDIEHVRLALGCPYADLERRLLRLPRVKQNQPDPENPSECV